MEELVSVQVKTFIKEKDLLKDTYTFTRVKENEVMLETGNGVLRMTRRSESVKKRVTICY